jgi:hypothetical protein
MTEKSGHFDGGRWVEDMVPSTPAAEGSEIDQRFSEAKKSVITSIDQMIGVTRDLVTTEEGKQYIEKTMKDTQSQIQKSFDSAISRVKAEVDKQVKQQSAKKKK